MPFDGPNSEDRFRRAPASRANRSRAAARAPFDAPSHAAIEVRKKRNAWNYVFYIALVVFVISAVALGALVFSYWQGQQVYRGVAEASGLEASDITEQTEIERIEVDWDRLLAINPDTVAWIYIPGTNVNYPVVQGKDNDFWLNHDFEGKNGWLAQFGTIFQEYRNSKNFADEANFMFGHHLNDGSMFSAIDAMKDREKFESSRTVYILTPQGNYRLRTFALLHVDADDLLVQPTFESPQLFADYIQDKMNRSLFSPRDVAAPSEIRKVFAFSTCDNLPQNGRYVLYAYVEESTVAGASAGSGDGDAAAFDEASAAASAAAGQRAEAA